MKILNDVLGYKDLKIYQDPKMFNFTLDSILVSRFVNLSNKRKKIVDFGTNNAIIPLIISRYTKADIIGVEIQPDAVNLAIESVKYNNLSNQIKIVCDDIKNFAKQNANKFDIVICNPPFFKMEGKPKLKQESIAIVNARHEITITLDEIIQNGAKVLKNGGIITLVHRAERLAEIIEYFKKYKIITKRIQFVHSKENQPAKTVLIDGVLDGNVGVEILAPIIAHNNDETYTDNLLKYFVD